MIENFLEIDKSSPISQAEVNPFLEAAGASSFRNALKLLLTDGSVLSSENFHQIVLVKAVGSEDKARQAIELMESKSTIALSNLMKEIFQIVVSGKLLHDLLPEKVENGKQNNEIIALEIATRLKERMPPVFVTNIVPLAMRKGAKPIAQAIAASTAKGLLSVREKHSQLMGSEYQDVIQKSYELGIIEPLLGVSICPKCKNWEIRASEYPVAQLSCPHCKEEWLDITGFTLRDPYLELKQQSKDLPIFISAYIKSQAAYPISVYALVPMKDKTGEIDVYIRETETGIECKCFQDPHVTTESKLRSEAGKLKKQIEKYFEIGLKNVILVTNLSEPDSGKLHKILQEKYSQEVKVLPGEVDQLLKALTDLAKEADGCYQINLTQRIQKELGQS
jgi:hypothetical protein